jgi:glutamyl-tRNA synthetase
MSQQLADLLFPDVTKTIGDYETQYPLRPEGQKVSRFAPSPTGFLHIGWVYSAYVGEKFVHQSGQNGVFFVRIEDTDQKREMEGGVAQIINGLKQFGISIDEGRIGPDFTDVGAYGPYLQSERKEIYRTFVKHLVAEGKAYPCWMSEEEIESTRNMQQAAKKVPWIYGHYSKRREASFDAQRDMIDAGTPFVIRLKAPAQLGDKIVVKDLIKGEVSTQANFLDMVLLKSTDGLPTYHMAHLVDDHLMRTTHVIRADEWFASMPLHVQLFEMFGFEPLQYAHISPLLKLDPETGNKRKLSKRHDPEANVQWFIEQGIPTDAIWEFLTNIIDPFFEDWQKNNPDKTYKDYVFHIERMNTAGALFDMTKLLFVSKEWLAKIDKETFTQKALAWAKEFGGSVHVMDGEAIVEKQLYELMQENPAYTFAALNIERMTDADPKRYRKFSDVREQLPAFYDNAWEALRKDAPAVPEVCDNDRMAAFLGEYESVLNLAMSKDQWFAQFKELGAKHGFAASNADFKAGGYVGKIGDLAMYFRIKLLCSSTTPDLYESMGVMGKERVMKRLRG